MIVGFLADKIPYETRRGWGVYSCQLLKALLSVDTKNAYRCFYNLFLRGRRDLVLNVDQSNLENVVWPIPGRIMDLIWERLRLLPVESFLGNVDLLHVPYEFLPRARSARTVVTVHDVTFLKHPEQLPPAFVRLHTQRIKRITERADGIIAISESTKRDLLEFTGVAEERVRVILPGVARYLRPIKDKASISAVSERYGIGGSYLLYVGAADEDKNLVRLASAFSAIRKDYPGLKLVLAGSLEWGFDRLMERLAAMNITDDIILTGFVAGDDLPALYSGARLLAIPSIHEGFGLPALEAMACGTPVLSSNVASLPEVVGDAGVLVDPYSVEAIEKGVRSLLEDALFAETCGRIGLERAQRFTWEATAKQVISFYEELCESR